MTAGWFGVDLDGTLAKHEPGTGVDHVGEPIPLMLERVREWLADGRVVKIVTARVARRSWDRTESEHQRALIKAWCREHLGQELEVTCEKDYGMLELWDDRAVGVLLNEGVRADDVAWAIARQTALDEVRHYEVKHAADGDAFTQIHTGSIFVYANPDDDSPFYVDAREARVLAARLLRAADQLDAASPAATTPAADCG